MLDGKIMTQVYSYSYQLEFLQLVHRVTHVATIGSPKWQLRESHSLNSFTAKSVPAGTKLILFGRYILNIYVGIVRYILRKTKTRHTKIYLPTQRTNWQISYDIN
jgi:hypothetical protein